MKIVPQISEAEWYVMKILWAEAPQLASQIIEELRDSRAWKDKTIKSLISRLVKKKAIGFEKDNRAYKYFPLVTEEECIKAESQSFFKRVYGGALKPLLANFLEDRKLSKEEIDELKSILEQKQDEQ